MTMKLSFFPIAIKKSAVRDHYPGGEEQFRLDYPHVCEDRFLYGMSSMSSGEIPELIGELERSGLHIESSCATCHDFDDTIDSCQDIRFVSCSDPWVPRWNVWLAKDDSGEMKKDGQILLALMADRGWDFSVSTNDASMSIEEAAAQFFMERDWDFCFPLGVN